MKKSPVLDVELPVMSESEARDAVKAINRAVSVAGETLLKLHNRRGWESLGYKSWEQCVDKEFSASRATVFRHLRIAQVEESLADQSQVETVGAKKPKLNDKQAKALSVVDPDKREEVWREAKKRTGSDNPPAGAIEEVVNDLPPEPPTEQEPPPKKRDKRLEQAVSMINGHKMLERIGLLIAEVECHWPELLPQLAINLESHFKRIRTPQSNVVNLERKEA